MIKPGKTSWFFPSMKIYLFMFSCYLKVLAFAMRIRTCWIWFQLLCPHWMCRRSPFFRVIFHSTLARLDKRFLGDLLICMLTELNGCKPRQMFSPVTSAWHPAGAKCKQPEGSWAIHLHRWKYFSWYFIFYMFRNLEIREPSTLICLEVLK